MKIEGTNYTRVTLEEATKIICYALSHWHIKWHYTSRPEIAELDLENPENKDLMEIRLDNDKLRSITIYTDSETVIYDIKEDKEDE